MSASEKYLPLFDEPQKNATPFDRLLGWSADWQYMLDPEDKPIPLDDIESLDPPVTEITVERGMTVSEMAQANNCTVKELVDLNNLRDANRIWPGQRIIIPAKAYQYNEPDEATRAAAPAPTPCTISFTFEDVIEKPINKLRVKIESATGQVVETLTDEAGKIADFVMEKADEISVYVSAGGNKVKKAATFTPMEGKNKVTLNSPKVRVKGMAATVKGSPGTVTTDKHPVNTVTTGRDEQGKPVTVISHTCPNKYDLNLKKNNGYWEDICFASYTSGIIPQSIAALIDAEAAKDDNGVWKADSKAISADKTRKLKAARKKAGLEGDVTVYASSAAGMTQFTNATWLDEAFREGTTLNQYARIQGWIADKPVVDEAGKIKRRLITRKPHLEQKFQVKPDEWLTEKEILKGGYLSGITPYPPRATQNLSDLLKLRFKSHYAIMAAVDYGKHNLDGLKKAGYNVDALNDAEKAKTMYLCHHLGLKDAKAFIENTMTEARAKHIFFQQMKQEDAKVYVNRNGSSYVKGHRAWLSQYINGKIILFNFYCHNIQFTQQLSDVNLSNVVKKIKG